MIDLTYIRALAFEAGVRFFGVHHMRNRYKRSIRAFEEVVELMQSVEIEKETLHLAIDVVYERRQGSSQKEIGHALLALIVLSGNVGMEPEWAIKNAVMSFLNRDPVGMAKRNAEKDALGL